MILRTTVILCCVFLQHVNTAEYYNSSQPTIWDLFNWKITLQRQHQDEITLRGLLEETLAQEDVKIPGATCNETHEWMGKTGLPGFVMQCKCNLSSSTFVPENMSCVANSELKQGCQFTTGSWRWSTSWIWDTVDDALIMLDTKNGITTGLNASTTEYQSCSVESLSYRTEDMTWAEASDYFFNYSKPVMFKLNNMWHLSWNVKNLQKTVKKSLQGKMLKFQIECEKPGPPQNEDEELEITSCLLVKVTGKFNISSKYWAMSQNTTANVEARTTTPTSDLNTLLISLLIPLCLVLLIVGVFIAVCYIRRTACFAEGQDLRQVTVLHDDVVQTKLIKNPADESTV